MNETWKKSKSEWLHTTSSWLIHWVHGYEDKKTEFNSLSMFIFSRSKFCYYIYKHTQYKCNKNNFVFYELVKIKQERNTSTKHNKRNKNNSNIWASDLFYRYINPPIKNKNACKNKISPLNSKKRNEQSQCKSKVKTKLRPCKLFLILRALRNISRCLHDP